MVTRVASVAEDWTSVFLGQIFEFKNGLNKEKRFFGLGTPIVNYMDVYSSSHMVASEIGGRVTVTPAEQDNFSARRGDVFFTRTSETVEEIGMASVLLDDLENAVFSGFVLRARPTRNSLDSVFAGYALRSEAVRRQIATTASYTTRALTNGRLLSAVRLAVPPLVEQKAIAKALSDMDALVKALESLIAKKRAIKRGVAQELLSGDVRLPGFTGRWSVTRLANFGSTYGGLVGKNKNDFGRGTARYIPFTNIMADVVIDLEKLPLVDVKAGEHQNRTKKGDLFFNGSSETPEEVGMCSLLTDDVSDLYLNSFCFGFRVREDAPVSALYLAYLFRSNRGRRMVAALAQGATRYNLSKRALVEVPFACPDRNEQEAIASALFEMDQELNVLIKRLTKVRQVRHGMMQELLTGRMRFL